MAGGGCRDLPPQHAEHKDRQHATHPKAHSLRFEETFYSAPKVRGTETTARTYWSSHRLALRGTESPTLEQEEVG